MKKVICTALVDSARCDTRQSTVPHTTEQYSTVQDCMEAPVPYGLHVRAVVCSVLYWASFVTIPCNALGPISAEFHSIPRAKQFTTLPDPVCNWVSMVLVQVSNWVCKAECFIARGRVHPVVL